MNPATGTKKLAPVRHESIVNLKRKHVDEVRERDWGGTVDRVRVVLFVTAHVLQGHFFKGGPAILKHHKHSQQK